MSEVKMQETALTEATPHSDDAVADASAGDALPKGPAAASAAAPDATTAIAPTTAEAFAETPAPGTASHDILTTTASDGAISDDAASDDAASDGAASDDAASWGSPWSAVESGWDGDEPASAASSQANATDDETAGAPPLPPEPPVPPYESGAVIPTPPPSDDDEAGATPERPMTLMEHLGELRTRLVRALIAVALAFTVCYSFAEILFKELCRPVVEALPAGSKLIFTALPEAFFVHLQVGFVAAVFMASPYIFYQIWGFIAPGLYDEEKKHIVPIALCSALFFILGASFCFFIVFPFAFTFFVGYANESIAAMPSLSEYLGFALKLLIAFGLIFEMPLFALFLARMGLITATMMREVRRYAILVIFIVAAILTPPDVVSQLLMAAPMLVLYECSIWVAAAFGKKPKVEPEEEKDSSEATA